MLSEDKYFQELNEAELWQRYCGFLDLSINEFMDIQKELLMDQIELVANSVLGKKIMGDRAPTSVEEFRDTVPLTTYDDYQPYLDERQEDAFAEKPEVWCRSAGRGGQPKWIPYTPDFLEKIAIRGLGSYILACASKGGEVNIGLGFRLIGAFPPPPYGSGTWFKLMQQRLSYRMFPPLEEAERASFQQRMQEGLITALEEGVDMASALGSVLVRIGEGFGEQTRSMKFTPRMLRPKTLFRYLRARLRSKREGRTILPKDLWRLKGILTGGVDTGIYKDDIFHYWGVKPYEFYVSTEAMMAAIQGWNKKAMTFIPDLVFLEFIPEERLKTRDDKDGQLSTVLLDEVEEGKSYELVITHLYGMPLLRYRTRDIFKVAGLRDEETGVNLPQFVFKHRLGDTIDLGALVELDEKGIWQAIRNTGIKYTEWSACKEWEGSQGYLHLYLELKEEREATEIASKIDEQLKAIDQDYRDIDY